MFKTEMFTKLIERLKSKKHIELILVVGLIIVILVIWFLGSNKNDTTTTSTSATISNDYITQLETKLQNLLGNINGAGNVDVMITLDGSSELVLAYSIDEKKNTTENNTNSGSSNKTETTNTSTTPIIISSNGSSSPLVLSEIQPPILGVVVLAEGANNIKVKLDLLKATQALLGVSSSQVEIFVKG